jgi:acyl carrier protein
MGQITMKTEFEDKSLEVLVEKLVSYLSTKVPDFSPQEHLDASFSSLGLNSTDHVEMTAIIEDSLQLNVEPTLAFDYPTINALVNYLQQHTPKVTEQEETD